MDIDIVLPWVDGSDKKMAHKRYEAMHNQVVDKDLNSVGRFRDSGLLKYVILSIKKFAPWVHRVYLVTDNQKPSWYQEDTVFKLIDHKDYIPNKYLPTFNSNVIELNVGKIKNLSEHFILFNDDMLINSPVDPTDFFSESGEPKDTAIYSVIPADNNFSHIVLNDAIILNKHFNKWEGIKNNWSKFFNPHYGSQLIRSFLSLPWSGIVGFYNPHIPTSYKKSSFKKIWELEPELLDFCSQNKFRTKSDISHWLVRYYQLQSGSFSPRSAKFGKFYEDFETDKIIRDIRQETHKLLCINDSGTLNINKELGLIIEALNKKFKVD